MERNDLTPEESFEIIKKAIINFKMNYRESSKVFLLWGWILTFACISNFVIVKILQSKEAYESMNLFILGNWLVFCSVGFVILLLMTRKTNMGKKVYSHIESYVKNLWWVIAASFVVATFICIRLEVTPPPIMLLIAGIATTTSGLLIKFKPLIIGGMTFFLFSIATAFVTNEYISLITGAAVICGYLVPGYFLKSAKE